MQNALAMRVFDRRADLPEQFEALSDGQAIPVAVFQQRFAVDVFHYQIRRAVRCCAAVIQAGDIRMVERG